MDGRRRLDSLAWPAVDRTRPVLVVPIGSCEQHGPHLPLSTDTVIATAVAERAVGALDDAVLGPALAVTASGEHQGFAGTLSIGSAAMEEVVVELVRSADWARAVVLVNGHGGNRGPVDRATARLVDEGRRVLSWWPRIDGGDLHAGHTETSLMLAIRPDLVDVGAARPGVPIDPTTLASIVRGGVRAVSPNGVLGDPAAASADHGQVLLEQLVGDLARRLAGWEAAGPADRPAGGTR